MGILEGMGFLFICLSCIGQTEAIDRLETGWLYVLRLITFASIAVSLVLDRSGVQH